MSEIAREYPNLLGRVRGQGTFAAVSAVNIQTRDQLIHSLRQKGVEAGGSGSCTIRLRPSMIFQPTHAAEFLNIFAEVCAETEVVGEPMWTMENQVGLHTTTPPDNEESQPIGHA